MERTQSQNSVQYNQQQRNFDFTGKQFSQAIEYVDRLEQSFHRLDQATTNLASAIKRLTESINETTYELNQLVESNTQQFADEYTSQQIDAENDLNPTSKNQSARREKTRTIELDF